MNEVVERWTNRWKGRLGQLHCTLCTVTLLSMLNQGFIKILNSPEDNQSLLLGKDY